MHRSLRPCLGCLLALLSISSFAGAALADPARLALVIGNSAYALASPPLTSLKDAGLVARTLSQAGFAVTAAGDADRGRLESVLDGFLAETANAGPDAILVVYLAGVGLQYSGSVYVVPIGATIAHDGDIATEAVSVTAFLQRLEALPAKARVFLLDLAHERPFAPASLSIAGGLPLVQPAAGTIVGQNAAPGTIAIADVSPYGVYARALSEVIATTNLPVSTQLERVRMRLGMLSNGANVPWNAGTIPPDISLGGSGVSPPPPSGIAAKVVATTAETAYVAALADDSLEAYSAFLATYPDDALAARVRTMEAVRREAVIWDECLHADLDRAYWTYLRRYRHGPHFDDAKRRLAMLHAALEPPPRFDIYFYTSAASPQPWEATLVDRTAIVLDEPAWRQTPVTDAGQPARDPAFYEELPPPPLALPGTVPIADPIVRRADLSERQAPRPIAQPDVPSVGSIVCESHFEPDGSWIASSTMDGKSLFVTRPIETKNGMSTILQTASDGTILSRTIGTHDKNGTTIVQTGPDGGLLTKAVTRDDGAGGRSTVLTNGGGQLIAIIQVDAQGVTRSKRGPVTLRDQVLVLGATPGDKPTVAVLGRTTATPVAAPPDQTQLPQIPPQQIQPQQAFEPQPPPPLAMPASMLPDPVAAPSPTGKGAVPSVNTLAPIVAPVGAKVGPASVPVAKPGAELPKIAPLPPRRVKAVTTPGKVTRSATRTATPRRKR